MWLLPRFRAAPRRRVRALRQPAVAGDDRRRPGRLHRAAPRSPGRSLNYVAAARAAGADGRRADAARAGAGAPRRSSRCCCWPTPGWQSLQRRRRDAAADAGRPGRQRLLRHHRAGRRAGAAGWRARSCSARGSLELARQQAQLNRPRDRGAEDGVLVVDRARPGARRQPGGAPPARAEGMSRPRAVPAARRRRPGRRWCDAVERAFADGAWPEAGRDVAARSSSPARTRDAARARPLHARSASRRRARSSACCSSRTCANVQARIRTEKLAAMGRVSAGIAHEIRNPLAAIAQANALLAEDADRPGAAPADAHGDRQRRAAEAHRRRRDGGGARRGAATCGAIDATAQVAAVVRRMGARRAACALGERQRAAASSCRPSRSACCSTPSTCAACSSTCSTTRCRYASERAGRDPGAADARDDAPARCLQRLRATARRSRPTSSAICSSPSSRRAAAAPGWACTFAASCASATARASTTSAARSPRRAGAQRVRRRFMRARRPRLTQ